MTNENIERQSEGIVVRQLPVIEYVVSLMSEVPRVPKRIYYLRPDGTALYRTYEFHDLKKEDKETQLIGILEKYNEVYWKHIEGSISRGIELDTERKQIIEFEYGENPVVSKSLWVYPDNRVELYETGKNPSPIDNKTLIYRLTKLASIPNKEWEVVERDIYGR